MKQINMLVGIYSMCLHFIQDVSSSHLWFDNDTPKIKQIVLEHRTTYSLKNIILRKVKLFDYFQSVRFLKISLVEYN